MRILSKMDRKRISLLFLILLLSIILSVAVILVAQQASATHPGLSVTVDTVNGNPVPPPPNLRNPIEITGTFSVERPSVGLEKEYGILIEWGDGSPDTVWQYSDPNNASPYLTWIPNDPNANYFEGTYNTNPGGGYPDMGHNYATGGSYTITVSLFHSQIPGSEKAGASVSLLVHVLVPQISVSKTGPVYAHEGDTIAYTIAVTNPSTNTVMYKVSVVDSLLGDLTANYSASLAPSTSESKTFTYVVPTPSGNVLNTVTVTYEDLFNDTKTANASWTVIVLHPSILVTKTGPAYAHEGDTITYTITVTNPSSGTMTKVSVIDSVLGDISGSFSATLAASTSESKTFDYTVPTSGGTLTNTVTATYKDVSNQQWTANASWTVTVLHPSIKVSKTGPAYAHEGDTITYTIIVNNTGDCALYNVLVDDTLLGPVYTGDLAKGETRAFGPSYDMPTPSRDVSNTVTASGSDTLGLSVSDSASWLVIVQHNITFYQPAGVGSDFTGTVVTIDSSNYGVSDLPVSFWWDDGSTHSFSFASPLSVDETKQYVWTSTTGLSNLQTDLLTITGSGSITGNYKTQYHLTVDTNPPGVDTPTGSGWYDADSSASISTAQYVDVVTDLSRYRFNGWTTGDMLEITDPQAPSTMVLMDKGKTVTANYILQYFITVTSDHDNPTPSAWVDAGQDFTASVTSPTEIVPNDHQWVCTGYSLDGDALTAGTSYTFTDVQSAHSIGFSWKEQFWIQVDSAHDAPTTSAWVDQGNDFTASVTSPTETVPNDHQWVCTGYSVDAGTDQAGTTYTFTNVQAAHSITFTWKEQFWIQVDSAHDAPTTSQWVDQGGDLAVGVTSPADDNGAGTRYRCTGYTLDSIQPVADGSTSYTFSDVQSAHTITFNWIAQYRLIVASTHDSPSPAGTNWYDAGTPITGSVSTPADEVQGTRYRCIGWSGTGSVPPSGTGASVSFTITKPSTLIWSWIAQYKLTVASDHDTPDPSVGDHWYDAATQITASVTSPADDDGLGTRYACTGFTGSGSVPSSGTSASVTFAMGAPSTITWNWVAQYRLTVASDHDAPDPSVGEHWYDAGTSIAASVTSPADDDAAGTRYRCTGWNGTGSTPSTGTETTMSFTMTQPSTLTWNWITQYRLTVTSAHDSPVPSVGEHWYDTGTAISASISTPADETDGTRWRFTDFTGTGSAPSGSNTSTSFNIEEPSTLTWNWITQYFITVTSPHDNPTPSAWVDAGQDFAASVTSPTEIAPNDHRWVCTGYSTDAGTTQAGTSYTFTNVQAPHTIEFTWKEQFWIQVNSAHDAPTASQWVDQGGDLAVSVTSPADDDGAGTRYRCTGYTLDSKSPIVDGTISYNFANVQSAHNITFNWVAQYYLTMSTNLGTVSPGNGWYDEGSNVAISAASPQTVEGNGYAWHGWTGTGTISYTGLVNPAEITVNSPISETAYWKIIAELTIFVSNETIEKGDRIAVYGETHPVDSPAEVNVMYTAPNGTQITHTVQTDDEGHYNDTLLLGEQPVYALLDQKGQWVITASRSGSINREDAASSATVGVAAAEMFQFPLILIALILIAVLVILYVVVNRRTDEQKQPHRTWRRATVILALVALILGAVSLVLNWVSIAGTVTANEQTYPVNIGLYPFSPGSVSIESLQYKGPDIPSLINSAWGAVPKNIPPVIALYLIPVACVLALACAYKPKTQRQKTAKLVILVLAGALVLAAVVQSLTFIGTYASISSGATTGYSFGLLIAMLAGLLALIASLYGTKETAPQAEPKEPTLPERAVQNTPP